ncbi:hypothetical protein [uncultured Roseobacter sp.]|uniref:hypothetical protein n=1 Tax=uncultured Roseobacter sp. TaxID=114847 RepID=UPI002625579C|nr:hypothetical protein [uncultured Roseobacter sp.]
MPETRTIMDKGQAETLVAFLMDLPVPFTVTVKDGKVRSTRQNKMQRKWCTEVAEQREDMTAEEVRGFSKAMFGVPILCRDDPIFAEKYLTTIKPLSYETKLSIMQEPFDFGVTRLMTTKQKAEYLTAMHAYWVSKGIVLTEPEE